MILKLTDKRREVENIFSFFFEPESKIEYKPGQFLRYHIPDGNSDERGENRFFSISSAPSENIIRLTTRLIPDGSTFKKNLFSLKQGQTIEAFGPSGKFSINDPDREYVFIAGGIGITPFRSIIIEAKQKGLPLKALLVYATRNEEAVFLEELKTLTGELTGFKIIQVISSKNFKEQSAAAFKAIPGKLDGDLIQKLVPDFKNKMFYISGPEEMVMDLEQAVWILGIPKEDTKRDYFPGYKEY
jgi:glycine betaine catabolism B